MRACRVSLLCPGAPLNKEPSPSRSSSPASWLESFSRHPGNGQGPQLPTTHAERLSLTPSLPQCPRSPSSPGPQDPAWTPGAMWLSGQLSPMGPSFPRGFISASASVGLYTSPTRTLRDARGEFGYLFKERSTLSLRIPFLSLPDEGTS